MLVACFTFNALLVLYEQTSAPCVNTTTAAAAAGAHNTTHVEPLSLLSPTLPALFATVQYPGNQVSQSVSYSTKGLSVCLSVCLCSGVAYKVVLSVVVVVGD